MPHHPPQAPPPSERTEQRRRAILDAASALFLEKGYAATTLADVVARSGGSLATVYSLFGSKRGLFEVILREHANPIIESITLADGSTDPESRLLAIGRRYLQQILDPRYVAWWRAMCAEAPHIPELRDILLSKEGGPVMQSLTAYLKAQSKTGALDIADTERAAGQFFELVRGRLYRRALVGDTGRPRPAEIDEQVRSAVHVFLHGYAGHPGRARQRRSPRRLS
ncbi:MAG TPA: TetR/AcrR family transcriptional regulator [Candidatus Krumholzibacteria bacterium]|nr:TetR/AcrR family transcriptional regulator [Candidatus Krumholzibacteria bacterium]